MVNKTLKKCLNSLRPQKALHPLERWLIDCYRPKANIDGTLKIRAIQTRGIDLMLTMKQPNKVEQSAELDCN